MRIGDWSSDGCSSDLVALPESAAAHLLRVLRLDVGDGCVLFNGDGHDYDARIVTAGKRGGEVEVIGMREVGVESPLRIVLVQGIAREIGRASRRERVCKYVWISVVCVTLKKKT